MELLVAIVIFGFVMTLVSQTVYQVSHVVRAADGATRRLNEHWSSGWSASSLIANLAAPSDAPSPVLGGSATHLAGFSTQPLADRGLGVEAFELQLQPSDEGDRTLLLAAAPAQFPPASPRLVASFPGRVEFAYADQTGTLSPTWPPTTRKSGEEELPHGVAVRDARSGKLVMWYAFQGETMKRRPPVKPFWETGS